MSSPPTDNPKKNYKSTLNLPQTAFAMEAKLVANEPARIARWQEMRLYEKIQTARAGGGKGKWILHDGPPFANGDIHIGHLINKTLKDVFLRYKTMAGYQTPYVPGWDCHGLPIEHKIQQELGPKLREMSVVDVRKRCFDYAQKYADIQSKQFQRLGILGEWENPYLTMKSEYEAETLEVFARFVEAGLVYKRLKPVHWSIANQTALADAELEYKDVDDKTVYVEFPAVDGENSYLIWTTTPWTLPANLAIAVHPDVEYSYVKYRRGGKDRVTVVASALIERVFANRDGVERGETIKTVLGKDLVGKEYRHPFMNRASRIVHAEYVTTTDGTGLVHTAPGHGEDDYHTGQREGLDIYCPVQGNGRFDNTVPDWIQGKTVWEANPIVTERLRQLDVLFAEEMIRHSYPHDWRSKTPIIFRATEQWFVAMDKPFRVPGDDEWLLPKTLRSRALNCILINPNATLTEEQMQQIAAQRREHEDLQMQESDARDAGELRKKFEPGSPEYQRAMAEISFGHPISFVPGWGANRLHGMLLSRPDWCVSRQRAWGLPIPVFYNEMGDALLTPESVRAVARRVREKGSDVWFTESPSELLGEHDPGPNFPKDKLRKEKDIFDVWFESGSSWRAVLQCRSYLHYPADLYLEGSDQHRGWFQLSMLPALGATGTPPFKQVLTHGFVVKPDGTKVSKSDKEYVTATKEIDTHGADLLRLWTCSVDYQNDIPTSPKTIKEFGDKYRKIRNTLRYLLSNLYDFDPKQHAVGEIPQRSLDGWVSDQLDQLIADVTDAYEKYQTHRVFRLLHDFCAVQISAIYGNAMKDRLYCESPDSPLRRRSQTVMHRIAIALTKLLAPMLIFTADETWEHIQHKPHEEAQMPSVHLALLPQASGATVSDEQRAEWALLMDLRDQALGQLDALKKEAGVNKALDAEVIYQIDSDDLRRQLQKYGADLEDLVGAGFHSFAEKGEKGPAVEVRVVDRRSTYQACARSWKRRPDVGSDAEYPDLCLRDANTVKRMR